MNSNKYYDNAAAAQVIGCVIKNPSLMDDDGRYFFNQDDFVSDIHKILFGSVYNLYMMGAKDISLKTVSDYLQGREKSLGIFTSGKGDELFLEFSQNADLENFDYYYSRLKKMTLLREYEKSGVSVKWLYDPDNLLDIAEKQKQEDYLNSLSLNSIADLVDNRILNVREKYIDNATDESIKLGDSLDETIAALQSTPTVGSPLYGKYINTITKGARLGCFFLRSAATSVGKTRTMVADFCNIACSEMYIPETKEWVSLGASQPALFISTEMDIQEIQTMALSFVSGINEEKIILNKIDFEEGQILNHAIDVLQAAPLFIEVLPDFTIKDIENTIKRNIRINHVQYIFFDYISTSLGILSEISQKTRGTNLREDTVLFILSTKLKQIAVDFNVFILSSTQLNMSYKTDPLPDQNLLRGAKSIADKVDIGEILLTPTESDRESLKEILNETGYTMPNIKLSVYKNRRGSFTRAYLWMNADKGTCRFNGMFATTWDYQPIPLEDLKITVSEDGGVNELR